MTEGTQADWDIIAAEQKIFAPQGGKRILDHLKLLGGDYGGFPVDRLEHCLQTATRAHRDGRDEEYVVMALLHDIGDTLGAFNHPDIGAAILKPFLSEENHWIVGQHGIFQGYYFFHYIGLDRDMREGFRGHPHFQACADFCEKYDQPAFDPNYDTAPLAFFEPMVMRLCAYPKTSIYKKVMVASE
jgi:predicted HD phosphohydrolase